MTAIQEPQASQTFPRAELERVLDWYRALPVCNDVVSRDDELADRIALELAKLRPRTSRSSPKVPVRSERARTVADGDDVTELREALRAADRGYRAYLRELRLGDVEPAEDWSTWFAEYLLGLR